jgi:SAM-dependent methyltransferase
MGIEKGYYIYQDITGRAGAKENYEHNPAAEKELFRSAIRELLNEYDSEIKGIEIGVLNGETSAFLLGINARITLAGIDPIIPDSMEATLIGSRDAIQKNTLFAGSRWTFIQDYSFNCYYHFQDDTIDFLFIDGDHTYEAVKRDFVLFFPKIKSGGLLFFHDSRMNRGGANFHVGSSEFVDQLIGGDERLELIGEAFSLTCFKKNKVKPDYAITKEQFQNFWGEDGYYEEFSWGIGIDRVCEAALYPFLSKSKKVMEIGSGGGTFTDRIVNNVLHTTAIDVIRMPKRFREYRDFTYVELANEDYSCTGVEDDTFDFVFTYNVFCHLSNSSLKEYLKSVHRVLKRGGDFVFMLSCYENLVRYGLEKGEGTYQLGDFLPIGHFYQSKETLPLIMEITQWDVMSENLTPEHRDILVHLRKN